MRDKAIEKRSIIEAVIIRAPFLCRIKWQDWADTFSRLGRNRNYWFANDVHPSYEMVRQTRYKDGVYQAHHEAYKAMDDKWRAWRRAHPIWSKVLCGIADALDEVAYQVVNVTEEHTVGLIDQVVNDIGDAVEKSEPFDDTLMCGMVLFILDHRVIRIEPPENATWRSNNIAFDDMVQVDLSPWTKDPLVCGGRLEREVIARFSDAHDCLMVKDLPKKNITKKQLDLRKEKEAIAEAVYDLGLVERGELL